MGVVRSDAAERRAAVEARGDTPVDPSAPDDFIHGSEDRITDRDRLETTAAAVGAELVFVRGGHNIYLSNPDEMVRHLAAALHE